MNLTIVASQPLKKQTLEVHDTGISYNESPGFGMGEWTHVSFGEIDAVLRSATGTVLSILAGRAVYRIQFNDRNPGHHEVIDRIVKGAVRSAQ